MSSNVPETVLGRDALIGPLRELLGFPKSLMLRRCVIDIVHDDVVRVYYETFMDKKILDFDFDSILRGAKIIGVKDIQSPTQVEDG